MSKKVSITLDDEILDFIDRLTSNRSSFINEVLWKEKRKIFSKELEDAYIAQTNDAEFQEEICAWDFMVSDGLNA